VVNSIYVEKSINGLENSLDIALQLPISNRWMKTFGIGNLGYSVQQTTDGGYIVTGETYNCAGVECCIWLIKTDEFGNEIWNKTFGNFDDSSNWGSSVQQTTDGGYIVIGTKSYFEYYPHIWLIKTDSNGKKIWERIIGGTSSYYGHCVQQIGDDEYILTGEARIENNGIDVLLIKTDAEHSMITKTFGGAESDGGYSVEQTTDGGFIITGYTKSFGAGSYDVWLIKTDENGNMEWSRTFGGFSDDYGFSGQQTTDGGYIITGITYSFGSGKYDSWLIKTDEFGNEIWNRTFGGAKLDGYPYNPYFCPPGDHRVQQTTDGGYIITGTTESYGAGDYDVWLIKTDSNGYETWNKTFGGAKYDDGRSVQQTTDGGYIIVGATNGFGVNFRGLLLIKTDSQGIANEPPDKPIITGRIIGITNKEYEYKFVSTDIEENDIEYCIDWGDNTSEVCIGPYPSGVEASAKHTWSEKGSYIIKAKARDIYGYESDWATLTVSMPKNRINILLNSLLDRLLYYLSFISIWSE